MAKKRFWTLICFGIAVLLSSTIIYWFYFSKPASFPTSEQIVDELNSAFPEAAASVIQDTMPVDKSHIVVPFISTKDDYSLSYWVWQKHKWNVAAIDTKGQPMVWKIDRNDPSSFYFVWNVHPEDNLSSIHFYLIKDREYHITEGMEHYSPRIQMEKGISLSEKSYGLMQLPDDLATVMSKSIKEESSKQPNKLFNDYFSEQCMFFGWIPYDQADQESFPERSVNGNGYSNGKVNKEQMMILDKGDIEYP